MQKRFISVFGGIGGFDKPLIDNGWECKGYYEIDKQCTQVYNYNFKTDYKPTDITKVKSENIENHDLLVAGVPCQSWSIAGKRKGFNDIRGSLWYDIFRIISVKKPKFVLLENVLGLLSHDDGRSFEIICEEMCALDYCIDFTVLNSKDFGVAQSRERVFILAIQKEYVSECDRI